MQSSHDSDENALRQGLRGTNEDLNQNQTQSQQISLSRNSCLSVQSKWLEINLDDANIDPELIYFVKDLAEILQAAPKPDHHADLHSNSDFR